MPRVPTPEGPLTDSIKGMMTDLNNTLVVLTDAAASTLGGKTQVTFAHLGKAYEMITDIERRLGNLTGPGECYTPPAPEPGYRVDRRPFPAEEPL